ncbi:MAG TPA: amidohydrolase family protein [Candidatus Binataceae bacterium]|nr:amidohydrolase family protein [Candidatus Binataceae bacterium]
MARVIDADSHFMEPLDLYERYIEPKFRARCLRYERDAKTGEHFTLIEDQRRPLNLKEMAIATGYGEKELGAGLGSLDTSKVFSGELVDMDKRIEFLDREGIESQFIYPTLGIIWEGYVADPELAAAHCRAYNRWTIEVCAKHRARLFPLGHISLRNPSAAIKELERLANDGVRGAFVGAMALEGKSLGSRDYDPVWDAAQALDMPIGLHLVINPHYVGHDWHTDSDPGFMFFSMNVIQDARMALTTMVYDGVFERFPRLRVATIEAGSGWVAEWLDRFQYRYSYMGHTTAMKRPPGEYFARNIWISADPEERLLPYMIDLLGDDKFFIGSDYPHAEGFVDPINNARRNLAKFPRLTVDKVLGENAAGFFGI